MSSNFIQQDISESDPDTPWYLAATKPRQELRAVEQLANQGIRAFSPQIKVEKIRKGVKYISGEALFSNYLFINISVNNSAWSKVRSTRGIRDWVKFSGKVAKLPKGLVEELIDISLSPENDMTIKRFEKGGKIRVLSGPFAGLSGVFEADDGDKRAMVLVEFLGQRSRLSLGNEQIATE